MKTFLNEVNSYRIDTEEEVETFIAEAKRQALEEGYILDSYTSKLREKKQKGEVIDTGYLVKISKVYAGFWDGLEGTVE